MNLSMRDAFFDKVYDLARKDRNVMIVSADMGAPSLDKFRRDLADQFVNVGIAEHNMIAVATGLAMSGKNVYTFAIAPFATSRCYEFTKVDLCLMKVPVKIVGVGTGFSYDDSGPTHHTTEDISIMRALPNMTILSPSDSVMAGVFAEMAYHSKDPVYIRLDRKKMPENTPASANQETFEDGFYEYGAKSHMPEAPKKDVCIVSTGNMVHTALDIRNKYLQNDKKIGVIDIYRLKPVPEGLKDALSHYTRVVSLEEHLLDGGLGSIISEVITDNDLPVKLKRIGLKDYHYIYGGRENIQKKVGLDLDSITKQIEKFIS